MADMLEKLRGMFRLAIWIGVASFLTCDLNAQITTYPWSSTASYPGGNFAAGSCVTSGGYIYCVGGDNVGGSDQAWFAPLTSAGIGTWQRTTSYGEGGTTIFLSCATDDINIYCVGGANLGGYSGDVNPDVWYAPISSAGIGSWTRATHAYGYPAIAILPGASFGGVPIWSQSCVTADGYLYCIGGLIRTYSFVTEGFGGASVPRTPSDGPTTDVFYTSLASLASGGAWQQTSGYGETIAGQSCVAYSGYIYCVAGTTGSALSDGDTADVWYAQILPNGGGLGPWTQTTTYGFGAAGGDAVDGLSCTAQLGYIVCVGGNNNHVWSAPLSSSGVGAWTPQQGYPTSIWELSCVPGPGNVSCVGGNPPASASSYAASWTTANSAGSTKSYVSQYVVNIELKDASSCVLLGGNWNAGDCVVQGNLNFGAGIVVQVDSGITLTLGTSANICTSTSDCTSPLFVTNSTTINVLGNFINYGNFTNASTGYIYNNNGANITNYGAFTNAGSILPINGFPSGTIANNGIFNNSGFIEIEPGKLSNAGTVTVTLGSQTCQSDPLFFSPISLLVMYGVWSSNTSTCTVGLTNPLAKPLDGEITVGPGYTLQIPAGVTLLNQGTFYVNGTLQNLGTFLNQGFLSNGSYEANTGFLWVNGTFTNSGTLTNQPDATIQILTGGLVSNSAQINDFTSSLIQVNPGGTLTNSSPGQIQVDSTSTIFDYGTIDNTGTITNAGSIGTQGSVLAAINNTSGGQIVNSGSGTTNGAGGTIATSIGPVTINLNASSCAGFGGSWTAGNSTCVAGTPTMTINGTTILKIGVGVTLENLGEIDVYGAIDVAGTIVNLSNILIGLVNGQGFITVENSGTITNFDLMVVEPFSASFINAGSIVNATAGHFENYGSLSNSNSIANYGTIDNDGTTLNTGSITDRCGATFNTSPSAFSGIVVVNGACPTQLPLEPTAVALVSSPNPALPATVVTMTATLSLRLATGTVTFFNGATSLGQATVSQGVASLVSVLPAGVLSLTAQYSGDTTHAPSTSSPIAETVNAGSPYNLPASVATADFNGDGKPDFVVANSGGITVSVSLGNGDGTFGAATPYTVGSGPVSVAVGDFNGDRRPDIAVANSNDNTLSILLGKGDGTFQPAETFSVNTSGFFTLAVGDFNRDGKQDLVVADGLLHVIVLPGKGDGTFGTAASYSAGLGPQSIAVGDFNGDGWPDLAVADYQGNTLDVLLNKGDGTFGAPSIVASSLNGPIFVVAEDFNADGRPDLAVASSQNAIGTNHGTISVFFGNPDGTFQMPKTYSPGQGPISIALGDFNGDGSADLAVANSGDNTVSLLFGIGNGTFQPAVNIPTGADPVSAAAADFNGDGVSDLVTANESGNSVTIFLGTPLTVGVAVNTSPAGQTFAVDGTLYASTQSFTWKVGSSHTLATTSPQAGATGTRAQFSSWSDSGTISHSVTASASITTYTAAFNTQYLVTTALSPDVAGTVTVLPSSSDGYYNAGSPVQLTAAPAGGYAFSNFTGTVAGAANPLSITLNGPVSETANLIALTSGVTLQSSANPSVLGHAVTLTATVSPAAATGKITFYDGTTVLGTSAISGAQASLTTSLLPSGVQKLKAYYGGGGGYDPSVSGVVGQTVTAVSEQGFLSANFSVGNVPIAVARGDFNRDGIQDLAVVNQGDGTVSVQLGNGDGTFRFSASYAVGFIDNGEFIAVADFNGDGYADLAVSGYDDTQAILLGNGDGTFQQRVLHPIAVTSGFTGMTVGDIDGDGRVDLISTGFFNGAGQLIVQLGNGDGTFQSPLISALADTQNAVTVADVNGDGFPDVVVAGANNNNVGVLLGNGNGTFQPPVTYPTGRQPQYIAAGDLNGDGFPDLVVTNGADNTVSVFLGKGDGTFTSAGNPATGGDPIFVAIGDLNGDGTPDLAVVNYVGNSVTALIGLGNGTFQPEANYTVGVSPSGLAVGEFNGDGRTDLAVANSGSNSITVLLGLTAAPDMRLSLSHKGNFAQGQTGATYTLAVTNAGPLATTAPVSVTVQLPAGLSATAISGAGWNNCSPLTCTRNDVLGAGASYPPITLTVNVAANAVASLTSTAVVSGGGELNTSNDTASDAATVLPQAAVSLNSTANPSVYNQALTLTATVSPAAATGTVSFLDGSTLLGIAPVVSGSAMLPGLVPPAGSHSLSALYSGDFNYGGNSGLLTLVVQKATPVITWSAPAAITSGTALSAIQLDATASVPGTFAYNPSAGAVLPVGNGETLSVTFTPTDIADYSTSTASATISVNAAAPQQIDVSSQVKVTTSGLVYSRATGTYSGTVTIQNTGSKAIAAPIQSVFTNLISGATLTNQTGKVPSGPYAGAPYITVAGNSPLAPGASATISVKFTYTGTAPISYVSKTLSGGF
jgi:hypothetical protein